MNIQDIHGAGVLFGAARNNPSRAVRRVSEEDSRKAREAFYKAVRSCDKASEKMMDKHLESVAESAKKRAEYLKKKSIADRARKTADNMRELNENILIERINHQNIIEEMRVREFNRQELLKPRGGD
jgi:hydroxypyruvate isomerase